MKQMCKKCKKEKERKEFRPYPKNNVRIGLICKECERKLGKDNRNKYNKYIQMTKEEIFENFKKIKYSEKIKDLIKEGYDVSYNGDSIIIFAKDEKRVYAKDSTKEIYDIIYAVYCYEREKIVVKGYNYKV